MHIVDILNEHLRNMVTDQFIEESHYTWSQQFNNISGRCSFPAGIQTLARNWRLECDTRTAREHGLFDVYFLDIQKELDFDADDNEKIIDRMIDLAVDFIGRLKHDKRIHIEEIDIRLQSMYDVNNKNLTGVHVMLDIKEQQGRCIPYLVTC